ncbi:MAG: hypothetical protein E7589_07370 [Ruminococcaceae bacterium]|nr:hypothetical protein [Oscillospiraceae bacterium]
MVITFSGHSDFINAGEYEQRMFDILDSIISDEHVDMYLGGYGNFDDFAYECCQKYKKIHSNISLIYVSPYLDNKKGLSIEKYDAMIYPEIEGKPRRFAIIYRNRYMVEKSDYVIAFVKHEWGGAYDTYRYAEKKGKVIFNIAKYAL